MKVKGGFRVVKSYGGKTTKSKIMTKSKAKAKLKK